MYQIIVKVPKNKKGIRFNDIHRKLREINPRIGEIYIENDYYIGWGYMQENDDISAFAKFANRGMEHKQGNSLTFIMESPRPASVFQKLPKIFAELEVSAIPLPGSNSDALEATP